MQHTFLGCSSLFLLDYRSWVVIEGHPSVLDNSEKWGVGDGLVKDFRFFFVAVDHGILPCR